MWAISHAKDREVRPHLPCFRPRQRILKSLSISKCLANGVDIFPSINSSRLEKMTHIDAQSGKLFPPLEGRIWAKGRLLYRVSLFAMLLSYYQATDTSETQTNPLKTAACTLPEDNPHKHALIIRRIWLIAKNLREKWCWHNEAFFVYGFTNSYSISTNCKYTKEIF